MHEPTGNIPGAGFWIPLLTLLLLLSAYLYGMRCSRRIGKSWSSFRLICWLCGIGLLLFAVAPPLAHYAHHDLRGHMIQHLLIGMLAPLGLVLAAPLSLTLRVLPAHKGRALSSILRSRPFHLISHPFVALILNIGGMFLLYLSPLYSVMQSNMGVHLMVHLHFLLAGYLFIWSVAGPDPAPGRPSFRLRLLVLFISMATHAWLSKLMYAYHFPQNTGHSIAETEEAALIMYYGGDLAEILLAIAFFSLWYRKRSRGRGLRRQGSPLLQSMKGFKL